MLCNYVPLYENSLTCGHNFFTTRKTSHSSFISIKRLHEIPTSTAPCGARNISRFSTNNSIYLANDTRYSNSYYWRRILTHMRSIKLCHFQWSWTNANPVFKVTPFFDSKYLTNGYIYGYSYYRRRIGNHIQTFEWHYFHWLEWSLSQISRSRYYSTSNNSKMVQDRAIVTMAD